MNNYNHKENKKKIAVFASGSGTNAENLINHFKNNFNAEVVLILTNNPNAQVLQRAQRHNVNTCLFNKEDLYDSTKVLNILKNANIDWIVLAGFLLKFPDLLIRNYPKHIINIHPSLLPKYGGKGMYGMNVHKAVVKNNEKETGITIHFVNENYDEGEIIFQTKTDVLPSDTAETVASKISILEHEHFPRVLEDLITKNRNA